MNTQTTFRTLLGTALLIGCVAAEAKPPTCAHPLGKWNDDNKSIIEIKTYDPTTGAIAGEFISPQEAASWPMVGWINPAPEASGSPGQTGKRNRADVFTLAVRWGDHGSVTAWTGTCTVNSHSGLAQIYTLWHTARPNANREWAHTITGPETLVPIE